MNYDSMYVAGSRLTQGLGAHEQYVLEDILNVEPAVATIRRGQLVAFDVKTIEAATGTTGLMTDPASNVNGLNAVHFINNLSEALHSPMGIVLHDIQRGERGSILVRGYCDLFADHGNNGTVGAWTPLGIPGINVSPATAILESWIDATSGMEVGDRVLAMNLVAQTVTVPTLVKAWFDGLSLTYLSAGA